MSYQDYKGNTFGGGYGYDVFVAHKNSENSIWDAPIRSSESPANSGWYPNLLFDTNDDTQLTTMWFLYAGYFPVFYQDFFKKDFLAFPLNRGFHMYLKRGMDGNLWFVYQIRTDEGDKIRLQKQENGNWLEELETIPTTNVKATPLGLSIDSEMISIPFLTFEDDHSALSIYRKDYKNSFIEQRKILSLTPGEAAFQSGTGWTSCEQSDIHALLTGNVNTGEIEMHCGHFEASNNGTSNGESTDSCDTDSWISRGVVGIESDKLGGASILMTPNCTPIVFYANGTNRTLNSWRFGDSPIPTEAPILTLLEPAETTLDKPIVTTSNYYSIEGDATNVDDVFNVTWQNHSLARFGLCSSNEGLWRCDVQLAYGDNEISLKSTNSVSITERKLIINRISDGSSGDKGIAIIINSTGSIFEDDATKDEISHPANAISSRVIRNLTASGFTLNDIY